MTTRRQRRHSAFTLVELLVVIGVIGILLGGIGLALGRGDKSTALQAGQNTLASLLGAVRGQAALAQSDAMLLVDVSQESEGFLRMFRVAVVNNSGNYDLVGTPVTLPGGIYLVPNDKSYSSRVEFDSAWTLTSSGFDGEDITSKLTNAALTDKWARVLTLSMRGTKSAPVGNRLILSPADVVSADLIRFSNPTLVRGATVSNYGVLTFLNDADSFNASPN